MIFFARFILSSAILLSMLCSQATAQHYGIPGIRNFSRTEYQGGTQNWAIAQAPDGMMYFGNNDGLLQFNGEQWSVYKDMGQINRSLCVDGKRIYVGSFNKFGYYEPDARGKLRYHSLLPLLKNRMNDFDEIWRIYKTSFGIVFQSFKALFIYNQDKIEIVNPRSKFHFSFYVNGLLWVDDEAEGLLQYRDGKLRQVSGCNTLTGSEIWTILPLNDDQVIIGTVKKGLFRYDGDKLLTWDKPVNTYLKKYQLFSGATIQNKYFAFGTIQNGLIISDTSGKIITHINKEKGLSNNTVLSIAGDHEGNIWLGLDNGISLIHFSSQLSYIKNYIDIGSGYVSVRLNDNLYLGTNQGLFYIRWTDFINPLKKREDFHLIEGTEGQVWSLAVVDNTMLCGHHSGVFEIKGTAAKKISSVAGGWTIRKAYKNDRLLLVGNYTGISVFEKDGAGWKYRNELSGFDQSSHFLEADANGYLWIGHGYKGVFRVKPDAEYRTALEVKFFDSKNGLPDNVGNSIYKIRNGVVAGTRQGVYRFNENTGRFEPDKMFSKLLPVAGLVDYLVQDEAGNIWYYNNQQPGVLRYQEDGTYKNITSPFADLAGMLIPTYGHINPLDAQNVLFGIEGGFACYYSGQYRDYSVETHLYLTNIHSGDTTEGSYNFNSSENTQQIIPRFKFRNNSVSFTYASNHYGELATKYQVFLKGFDESWSEWTSKNSKEYTNLPYGDYSFQVRTTLQNGMLSPIFSYSFIIAPPFYFSTLAWIIYFIALLAIVFFMYRFFLKTIAKSREKEKEQQRAKYKQREEQFKSEALENEKEMIRLRNEKLNMEMIHKEKELANSTMMIIQKNEILQKLMHDLNKVKSALPDEQHKNQINSTIRKISKEIDNEKQWQVFNTHVEQVHENLFTKLKQMYPELTPREISLCAYLRMNISSKEISTLMNISTRGVEISRYRIRKKLGLDRNANLTDFMMKL